MTKFSKSDRSSYLNSYNQDSNNINSYLKMTTLYDQDFAQWAEKMAKNLQNKRFSELYLNNLVEEIRDLSNRLSEKYQMSC